MATVRVYTISLPLDLAQAAEALAKRDSCSIDELFREAFRFYSAQHAPQDARTVLMEFGEYAQQRNPGYTEADVPRLVREVRLRQNDPE